MIKTIQNYFQSIHTQKSILLFNNKSLYFDFVREIFDGSNIQYNIVTNFNVQIQSHHIFIYPFFEFRVFNFNYYRSLDKEFGKPYFVYVRNNRSQLLESAFPNASFNLMNLLPELVNLYLTHPLFLDWIHQSSCREPHNDKLDRKLMTHLILETNPQYKASNDLSGDPYKEMVSRTTKTKIIYEHLPLHRYYEKYLSMNLKINELERGIYGSVF